MERLEAAQYILIALAAVAVVYTAAEARRARRAAERALACQGFQELSWARLFRALRKQAADAGQDASLFEPPERARDDRA